MFKKTISVLLSICLLMSIVPLSVHATNNTADDEVIYLEDGGYIKVSTQISPARVANTVDGSKTYTGYSNSGQMLWKAVLRATFAYSGAWYTCTTANCDVTIYSSHIYVISNNTVRSSNNAVTNLTLGVQSSGITVTQENYTIKLTCDSNGNIS